MSLIDEYLAKLPDAQRSALEHLRELIRSVAPGATESISYGIPTFGMHGPLVGFGAFEKHLTFYLLGTAVLSRHAEAVRGYKTGKGSIRFTPERPLPDDLVVELTRARLAENEERKGVT
jgi:uncharacterized protein YdhG (YjbR/CyaY superfamily)